MNRQEDAVRALVLFKTRRTHEGHWHGRSLSSGDEPRFFSGFFDGRTSQSDCVPTEWLPGPANRRVSWFLLQRQLEELRRVFEFRGHLVVEFLTENPSVIYVLNSLVGKVKQYFGDGCRRLSLSLFSESGSVADAILFVAIETSLQIEAAHEVLARFDDEWFIQKASSVHGRLNVELEYV